MKSPEKRKLFLDEIVVQSHIKLDLIDRIRLICGSQLIIRFEVATQYRFGDFVPRTSLLIEKVFRRRRPKVETEDQECPEPQKA